MKTLNMNTYLETFKNYSSHKGITGGTIHEFIKESVVEYCGGKCPVYYICYYHNGHKATIGGNYATNGKPELKTLETVDF